MGTLAVHIDAFILERHNAGRYSAASVVAVRYRLRGLDRHFGDRNIDRLTPRMVETWLATMHHLSPQTKHAHLSAARRFCRWMVMDGRMKKDPTLGVESIHRPKSMPRTLSAADKLAVLAATVTDRERLIVRLMLDMALRAGEVARARWEDYDERDGLLLVHGKGGKERLLPVPALTALVLNHAANRTTTGPIVESELTGGHIAPPRISQLMTALMWRSGIKQKPYDGRSGHSCRHTALSKFMDDCLDLRVVMEIGGHANLSSAAIYQHRADLPAMREAMEGRGEGDAA